MITCLSAVALVLALLQLELALPDGPVATTNVFRLDTSFIEMRREVICGIWETETEGRYWSMESGPDQPGAFTLWDHGTVLQITNRVKDTNLPTKAHLEFAWLDPTATNLVIVLNHRPLVVERDGQWIITFPVDKRRTNALFDMQAPASYAKARLAQETPEEREARRLSTLAITDPAAYQAELRVRGLWPVDLDEYLKRDRSKEP